LNTVPVDESWQRLGPGGGDPQAVVYIASTFRKAGAGGFGRSALKDFSDKPLTEESA